MEKQKVKIEYNDTKVFFFDHSLKTAYEHAMEFIKRNKNKFDMKLFLLNPSNFGEKWILDKIYTIK